MKKLAGVTLLALLGLLLSPGGLAPLAARVTDEQIQSAIDRGVAALLKEQTDRGWWSADGSLMGWNYPYNGGAETCAMLALAYAGVSMNDPKMQKGFDALLEFKMSRTYNCAMRIMTISKLMHRLDRERRERALEVLKADTAVLLKTQHPRGSWTYQGHPDEKELPKGPMTDVGVWDFSNTQMAMLGLSEAINAGLEIPMDAFKKAQELYLKAQLPDGGFNYGWPVQPVRNASYGSMTAAGVASLFITRDYLYRGIGCPCKGDRSGNRVPPAVDKSIEAGLAWLAKYFIATGHPTVLPDDSGLQALTLYWLYGCERVGLASGLKYFGGHDWYAEGAEFIVSRQLPEGTWGRVNNTAFAICFLVKGRAPILFNKLQFNGEWNNHPRDAANLARHVGSQKEQPIRWQIINLVAPVAEWHDAPILYVSAESPMTLSPEEKKKLRQFTDTGGTILFEASCGNRGAAKAWRTLAQEIWPEWEMKLLDKDHPLFSADQKMATGKLPLFFYGLDDGLRTFAFVSLADLSCAWSTMAVTQQGQLFTLGGNLYAYTTDHGLLRSRLAEKKTITRSAYLEAQSQLRSGTLNSMKVARVKHGGDWYVGRNYAPLEWFARLLAPPPDPTAPVDPTAAPAETAAAAPGAGGLLNLQFLADCEPSGLAAAGARVAYLAGRKGVSLGQSEAAALKKFLEDGGFLLAEAIMGDPRFDGEMQTLAGQMGLKLTALEAGDALLTGAMKGASGYNVTSVRYKFSLRTDRVGKPAPLIYSVSLGDRVVGLYSPFDVSFSQTGFEAWGCRGYDREDALALLTNMFLFASVN